MNRGVKKRESGGIEGAKSLGWVGLEQKWLVDSRSSAMLFALTNACWALPNHNLESDEILLAVSLSAGGGKRDPFLKNVFKL